MDFRDLIKFMLPSGTLEYFDFQDLKVSRGTTPSREIYTVHLVEKNILPKLPMKQKNKELRFKGY